MRYMIDKSEWHECKLCRIKIEELRKKYGGSYIYSNTVFRKHLEIDHNTTAEEYFNNIIPICCDKCNKYCILNKKRAANFFYHSACGRNPGQQQWASDAKITRLGPGNPMYGKKPWNLGKSYSQESRDKMRKSALKRIEQGNFKFTNTKPHIEFCKILDILHIKHSKEYIYGNYAFDVHLSEYNILIEVDGDYYHCNPVKYINGPINNVQRRTIIKDSRKSLFCKENNITLLRFWESDILHKKEEIICILKELLQLGKLVSDQPLI